MIISASLPAFGEVVAQEGSDSSKTPAVATPAVTQRVGFTDICMDDKGESFKSAVSVKLGAPCWGAEDSAHPYVFGRGISAAKNAETVKACRTELNYCDVQSNLILGAKCTCANATGTVTLMANTKK